MADGSSGSPKAWTASQVVAHTLTRARRLRDLTQEEVALRLSAHTGTRWTQSTVAQAEGSVTSDRVRQFTANELVALSRTFDLPVTWFLTPPDPGSGADRFHTADHPEGLAWDQLVVALVGHVDNYGVWADRMAHWTSQRPVVPIPASDQHRADSVVGWIAGPDRRMPLTAEEVAIAAAMGLLRKQFGPTDGALDVDFLGRLGSTLGQLEILVRTLSNYRPSDFVRATDIAAVGSKRATGEATE